MEINAITYLKVFIYFWFAWRFNQVALAVVIGYWCMSQSASDHVNSRENNYCVMFPLELMVAILWLLGYFLGLFIVLIIPFGWI